MHLKDPAAHLTELLCAKFCHDLAGPVGAVNNGIEFLVEQQDPEIKAQAVDLLKLSAQEALIKLQTYRMAYGVVKHAGDSSVKELKDIIRQFFAHGKITMDWPDHPSEALGMTVSNSLRRVIVNMITIVAGVLIYGGTVQVKAEKLSQGRVITVTGSGEKLKDDPEVFNILNAKGGDVELTTKNVQLYYLTHLAKDMDVVLKYAIEEKRVILTAQYTKAA